MTKQPRAAAIKASEAIKRISPSRGENYESASPSKSKEMVEGNIDPSLTSSSEEECYQSTSSNTLNKSVNQRRSQKGKTKRNSIKRTNRILSLLEIPETLHISKEAEEEAKKANSFHITDDLNQTVSWHLHKLFLNEYDMELMLKPGPPLQITDKAAIECLRFLDLWPEDKSKFNKSKAIRVEAKPEIGDDGTVKYIPFKSKLFLPQKYKNIDDLVDRALSMLQMESVIGKTTVKRNADGQHQHLRTMDKKAMKKTFLECLTGTGKKLLQTIVDASHSNFRNIESQFLKVLSEEHDETATFQDVCDYLQTSKDKCGIYIGYGVLEAGKVHYIYVGQSRYLKQRMNQHKDERRRSWLPAKFTKPAHYHYSKQCVRVEYLEMLCVPDSLNEIDTTLSISEAVFCAIFSTYRFDEKYLDARNAKGLPFFTSFHGANLSACIDQSRRNKAYVINRRNEKLCMMREAAIHAWLDRDHAMSILKYKKEGWASLQSIPIDESTIARLESETTRSFKALFDLESALLVEGKYEERIERVASNSHLWRLEQLSKDIYLDHDVCTELDRDGSGVISGLLKLEFSPSDESNCFFTPLGRFDNIFSKGLVLSFSMDDGKTYIPLRQTPNTRGIQRITKLIIRLVKLLSCNQKWSDLFERCVQELKEMDRTIYEVPEDFGKDQNFLYEILNGLRLLKIMADGSFRIQHSIGGYRTGESSSFAVIKLDTPDEAMKERLGLIENPKRGVPVRVNFASDYPFFRYVKLSQEDCSLAGSIGFDLQAPDLTWIPCKRPMDSHKAYLSTSMRKILQLLARGREIVLNYEVHDPDTFAYKTTSADLPKECEEETGYPIPPNFQARVIGLKQASPSGHYFVRYSKSFGNITVDFNVIAAIFGTPFPGLQDAYVEMRLDAWGPDGKKDIEEVHFLFRAVGTHNPWYINEYPLNQKMRKAIIQKLDELEESGAYTRQSEPDKAFEQRADNMLARRMIAGPSSGLLESKSPNLVQETLNDDSDELEYIDICTPPKNANMLKFKGEFFDKQESIADEGDESPQRALRKQKGKQRAIDSD